MSENIRGSWDIERVKKSFDDKNGSIKSCLNHTRFFKWCYNHPNDNYYLNYAMEPRKKTFKKYFDSEKVGRVLPTF